MEFKNIHTSLDLNIFKKNINFLEKNPDIINIDISLLHTVVQSTSLLSQLKSSLRLTPDNVLTFVIENVPIHSLRSPIREANRISSSILRKKQKHLICLGSGLGYLLYTPCIDELQSIILIEFQRLFLFALLCFISLESFYKKVKLSITFIDDIECNDFEFILPFLQNKNVKQLYIYVHHPLKQLFSKEVNHLENQLQQLFDRRLVNQATIIKFQKLLDKNYLLNLFSIYKSYTLTDLIIFLSTKKLVNVLVVSAGPSLTSSLKKIYVLRKSLFVICVDTAYIPLLQSGIIPDVVVAVDPQCTNHKYIVSPYTIPYISKSLWLLEPTLNYNIVYFLDEHNARMFYWDSSFKLDTLIFKEKRGTIKHGGSVSTNALDLAVQISKKNVILTGQDLSYSNYNTHVKGAVLESNTFICSSRFSNIETFSFSYSSELDPVLVKGIKDEKVYSDARLYLFLQWFERTVLQYKIDYSHLDFYNATTDGAYLEGFLHASLNKIVELDHGTIININDYKKNKINLKLDFILKILQKLYDDIFILAQLYNNNIEDCQLLENVYSKGNSQLSTFKQHKVNTVIERMNSNDKKIQSYSYANEVVSIGAQSAILQITENSIPEDNLSDKQLFLYQALYDSCLYILFYLKKILSFYSK